MGEEREEVGAAEEAGEHAEGEVPELDVHVGVGEEVVEEGGAGGLVEVEGVGARRGWRLGVGWLVEGG